MAKTKKSLSSRLLSALLAFIIVFGMAQPAVVGAVAATDKTGTVSTLVSGGTVSGSTATFSGTVLNWSPKNDAIGRFIDGWWIGVKVTPPEGMTAAQLQNSKYVSNGTVKSFWANKDSADGASQHYIGLWGIVNEGYLNDAIINGKDLNYVYNFDWDADGVYEQTVKMVVDADSITLKKNGVAVYPTSNSSDRASVSTITGGVTIKKNKSDIVVAEHNAVTALNWAPANDKRAVDGWWIGINVTAPSGIDLTKVTYQNKTSSGWGVAKDFNSNKDTADSIQLWGLLNENYLKTALDSGKNVNYQWRFDWNGDGVYEQLIHIKVDPSKIILKDSDSEQVFPALATVTPLTGGDVSGNQSNLQLVIEETTLTWSPADAELGRSSGWWVGMLVTVPDGYTADQLSKATYKSRFTSNGGTAWSNYASASFADKKDSDRQIQLWMVLNQALLDNYEKNGTKVKGEYVFDWDGDGTDDQKITMVVVPSDKIVLQKVDQTGFSFVNLYPVDQWMGEKFTNEAIGGQSSKAPVYEIVEGTDIAKIDAASGEVTFNKLGKIKVKATKPGDDVYNPAYAYYEVVSRSKSQDNFAFANSNPSIEIDFKEGTFANAASGGSGDGEITYTATPENIATVDKDGVVTFLTAGTVYITATKAADSTGLYDAATVTYSLVINKSEQEALEWVTCPSTITYDPAEQEVFSVGGGSDGAFVYNIIDGGEFASIDANNGKVTTKKADGTFTVQVLRKGTDGYNESAPITATVYVEKAQQDEFKFTEGSDSVVFDEKNNTYERAASGGSGDGKITYSFADVDSATVADIDPETGKLTIKAAGTVNVVATKDGAGCYVDTTAEYSIKIEPATPDFKVEEEVNLFYGVEDYLIDVETILGASDNYIFYIDGENEIGASVDAAGFVTFTDGTAQTGSVTVKVKKEADSQYVELEKEVKITLSYFETAEVPTIDGDKKAPESQWYTDDITIIPPEGYEICYTNKIADVWQEKLIFDTENEDGKVTVYLRNKENKAITDAIEVNGAFLDKTSPTDLEVTYETENWTRRVLDVIFFGYFNELFPTKEFYVTLKATDTGSGIASFEYNHGDGIAEVTSDENGVATHTFKIDSDFRDSIEFTVTDNAGRSTKYTNEGKVLVVDLTKPELEVSYSYNGDAYEEGGIIYTADDITVNFEIKESNFDLSLAEAEGKPLVTVNGEEVSVTWKNTADGVWSAPYVLNSDGEKHTIRIEYSDLSKNENVTYEKTIIFDMLDPSIDISYEGTLIKDDIYNPSRKATIKVIEDNFKASKVELKVSAVDINGDPVDLSSKAYADYVKNDVYWNHNEETSEHTLILEDFDISANYTVEMVYTDLAGNTSSTNLETFKVDSVSPTEVTIEYKQSLVEKIIEAVTFGFVSSDIEVIMSAEDSVSGIDYFNLTYIAEDGLNKSNKASFDVTEIAAVPDSSNNSLFTATYTIPAAARGKISIEAVDNATNKTNESDDMIFVADSTQPGFKTPEYTFATNESKEYNGVIYTKGDVTVDFSINEANFDLSLKTAESEDKAPVPVVEVNSVVQEKNWQQVGQTDEWIEKQIISGEGDYELQVSFADRAGNEMNSYYQEIRIDGTAPVIDITYDNVSARNTDKFNADRTAIVKIVEHNFRAEDVELTVLAEDITGKNVDISSKAYATYAKNADNWKYKDANGRFTEDAARAVNSDEHYLVLPTFDIDAVYSLEMTCTDLADNVSDSYTDAFTVDKEVSTITISYNEDKSFVEKLFSYIIYKDEAEVTVTVEDNTAGVESIEIAYNKQNGVSDKNKDSYKEQLAFVQDETNKNIFTASVHKIPADARGNISVTVVDMAGNTITKNGTEVIVVDNTAPTMNAIDNVEYIFKDDQVNEKDDIYYTKGDVKVNFTIDEANFDLSLLKGENETDAPAPIITVNGVKQSVKWNKVAGTDKYTSTNVSINGNGDYIVEVNYTDRSTNVMETYTKEIHIDGEKPVIEVSYDNNSAKNDNYYKADRTATVKITEHNFFAEQVTLEVAAKNLLGDVDVSSKKYGEYVKNADNWKYMDEEGNFTSDVTLAANSDEHYIILPVVDIEAEYEFIFNCTDLAENAAEEVTEKFTVDKTIPANIEIIYSASIVDKILNAVTYGFYQPEVTITATAEDVTAGVEYFQITYRQNDGKNNSNKTTYKTEIIPAVQDEDDPKLFSAMHTIPAQARGTVLVYVIDKAGNENTADDDKVLVVDTIEPQFIKANYFFTNEQKSEYNNIYYTQDKVEVNFTIEEANFDLSLLKAEDDTGDYAPVITVNDVKQSVEWTKIEGTDQWLSTNMPIVGNGDYILKVTYKDRSTNAMETYTKEIHIDNNKPVFDVVYDNNSPRNVDVYKADRTATITVTEHNFKPDEVELTASAKDITGKTVDISSKKYEEYVKTPANWTSNGDTHTLDVSGMKFDTDAVYELRFNYTDLAENKAEERTEKFTIDKTAPKNIKVEYSESIVDKIFDAISFGFYKHEVVVTVTAEDVTAGVESFTLTYTKQAGASDVNTDTFTAEPLAAVQDENDKKLFSAEYTIPAQARGNVSVKVMDRAGNEAGGNNSTFAVVDNIAPTREVLYTPYKILDRATLLDVESYKEGDDSILYYRDEAVVTFKITEANFDLSLKEEAANPVIKVNDTVVRVNWTKGDNDVWTATHTIKGDGDYVVTMTYKDLSTNQMVDYESCKIAIDSTVPVIEVKYDDGTPVQTINDLKYYETTQTVGIEITEHNFRADEVVLNVTAKDIQGNPVDISSKAYADYAKNRANWTSNGDVHTLNTAGMVFDKDAVYTFDIVYDDIADNYAADYAEDKFVVDHEGPTNIKITYSESVVEKVIEAITFGFYKAEVKVTISADDITSGVEFFDWTYTKQANTSEVNADDYGARIGAEGIIYNNSGKTATASFTIPANARGYISVIVTDRAHNTSSTADDAHINVVDDIAPSVSVEYTADSVDTKVQFVDGNKVTVDSFDKATTAYYNGNVTAKIVVNEANFFDGKRAENGVVYQMGIKLTKTDDNGEVEVVEYLPTGAAQKYAGATARYISWTTTGDVHTFSINYTDNADYVLEIDYADLSTNEAGITANDGVTGTKIYKSKVITVDKVAPVVTVDYQNRDVVHTINNRDYFDADQVATITVYEHNFRAEDFVATVTATDVINKNVVVENFRQTLMKDSNWKKNGNIYTIQLFYSVDANYAFDFEYKDLAQNKAADYEADLFTVDTTAPENLTVSYSTSVLDKVLESVTFGYYNAEMTVTITAEDDTAGVHYFVYSYIKTEGTSDVNTEFVNDRINDANKRIVYDGKKATTSFTIPKLLLKGDNQFNGTVEFTAFDCSENSTLLKDNRRVVVDNIAPSASISYGEVVQNVNNISYFDGNIVATITVNEANFYSEDVNVTVTKDGVSYPARVLWEDYNTDIHIGTLTLTENGDYFISISYKDRSDNAMMNYTSNRLTLDTVAPTISVSNIKANSANKDEKYGFTITVDDVNLDASTFRPVLVANVRNSNGSYQAKTISLGDMITVRSGKTYSYTVNNLTEDAVYSLTCSVEDMSGNSYSKVTLEDGKQYDSVRFSINRNGSTFAVDKSTYDLVNQYYVQNVQNDVVIEEINVDPVEHYTVKVNGEILKEGRDYKSIVSGFAGEWSKRTYIISKDVFDEEGEYSVIIESTDKTQTTSYSDVKNLKVAFVVDRTAPKLSITGLASGGRYQVKEQTVRVIPTDNDGRLYGMKVIVADSHGEPIKDINGKDISERFFMTGEEFLTYLEEHNGEVTFTIPEGLELQVKIICTDYAVSGEDGTKTNEYSETFTKVTVSQSGWVIFYANKPLFYGSIAGVVLLVGGIFFLIFLAKRREDDDEE